MPVRRKVQALIRRNRVLVALHLLGDPEGLVCEATNEHIARQAGLTVESTRRTLHELERDRTVVALAAGKGYPRRVIVFADHPGAHAFVYCRLRRGQRPSLHSGIAWGIYEAPETDPDIDDEGPAFFADEWL